MIYKFLSKVHVDGLLKGRFRFGRLRYFQLLELVTGDDWIGDKHEGLAKTNLNASIDKATPEGEVLAQRLEAAGILKMGEGGRAEFTNSRNINSIDCFVLCCSSGELQPLCDVMAGTSGRSRNAYDGCVHIADMGELGRRLWEHGEIDGTRLQEKFQRLVAGTVRYDWAERELQTGPVHYGDPFLKASKYLEQQEVRIVLLGPRSPMNMDALFVDCAATTELLSEVPINASGSPAATAQAAIPAEEALHQIRLIVADWYSREAADKEDDHPRLRSWPIDVASWEARIEESSKRSQLRQDAFDRDHRDWLIKLHFAARHLFDSTLRDRVDSAVVLGAPIRILVNRLEAVLDGLGRADSPAS